MRRRRGLDGGNLSFSGRVGSYSQRAAYFVHGEAVSLSAEGTAAAAAVERRLEEMLPQVMKFHGFERRGPDDPYLKDLLRSFKVDEDTVSLILFHPPLLE